MYRSRPKGDLEPESLSYLSSIKDDKKIVLYDIIGTQAHAIMLYEKGLIELKVLKPILNELQIFLHNPKLAEAQRYEDIHEAIEAHLIKKLGVDVGGRIQTGRSRNDQVILDIRMMARDELNIICSKLIILIGSILAKAEENLDAVMPLYTHLQQAQIGNLSHYFISYSEQLFRDLERLSIAYDGINKSPLGSGPVGGSGLPLDRNRTAHLLGFKGLVINSIDATSSRDSLLEVLSALSITMITLSRLAQDFILWSTEEFGYLEIADNLASTSSAMPQKKNPDPLELIRSKSAIVTGNLMTSLALLGSLPSGYNRDLQDLKLIFFSSLSVVSSTLSISNAIVKTLIVHKNRMKQVVHDSYANSIDIAEQLVLKNGLAFRTAHRFIGSLVKLAVEKKLSQLSRLSEVDLERITAGVSDDLKVKDVAKILSDMTPNKILLLRSPIGSPNPRQQKGMIKSSRVLLQKYRKKLLERTECLKKADKNLRNVILSYLKEL